MKKLLFFFLDFHPSFVEDIYLKLFRDGDAKQTRQIKKVFEKHGQTNERKRMKKQERESRIHKSMKNRKEKGTNVKVLKFQK